MGAVVTDGVPSLVFPYDGEATTVLKVPEPLPAYDGLTTITPGADTIVLSTNGKSVYADITIGAIPSNYGLITQVGSYIRVS